jgi:hypothetical protein
MDHVLNLHKWGFGVGDSYEWRRCKQTIVYLASNDVDKAWSPKGVKRKLKWMKLWS